VPRRTNLLMPASMPWAVATARYVPASRERYILDLSVSKRLIPSIDDLGFFTA
jgi:hypothetical protein